MTLAVLYSYLNWVSNFTVHFGDHDTNNDYAGNIVHLD